MIDLIIKLFFELICTVIIYVCIIDGEEKTKVVRVVLSTLGLIFYTLLAINIYEDPEFRDLLWKLEDFIYE